MDDHALIKIIICFTNGENFDGLTEMHQNTLLSNYVLYGTKKYTQGSGYGVATDTPWCYRNWDCVELTLYVTSTI